MGDTGRWGRGEAGERARARTEGLVGDERGSPALVGCGAAVGAKKKHSKSKKKPLDPFCASPFRPSVHLRKEQGKGRGK